MDESGFKVTRERIDRLVAFLPKFEIPGRKFCKGWFTHDNNGKPLAFPHPDYCDDVKEFFRIVWEDGWWVEDYDSAESKRLLSTVDALSAASIQDIRKVLTFCLRGERYVDGYWESILQEGRLQVLLRRIASLDLTAG